MNYNINKYYIIITSDSNICKALVEHPHNDINISCNILLIFFNWMKYYSLKLATNYVAYELVKIAYKLQIKHVTCQFICQNLLF